jgi:hypothetical protein
LKEVARVWNELSPEEKRPFIDKSNKEKEEYLAYVKKYGIV